MKKLIAVLMAIAMISALSVTAFAAIEAADGSASITVNGTLTPEVKPATYYVVLSETTLSFNYIGATYEWNQEDLDWVVAQDGEAHWEATTDTFDIENRSSVAVSATVTATSTGAVTLKVKTAAMGAAATTADVTLDAPAEGVADKETITVSVENALTAAGSLGSISVELN